MATWHHRTVASRRYEWVVPACEPWGAMLGDIRSALVGAELSWRSDHDYPENLQLPDDALKIKVGDEEIVIYYVTDEHIT